ncbi:TetR family transcriptional regulator [Amycolatopsis nigrescens]|uniref:TetR family transcriptional regulator n=1 Tax=Amycolatopsis nigrescens TaxID=381445 RepID=UPI0003754837|nr:TetR family transcriptional regulator [Amycolatopsis nigrescens]
MTLDQHPPGPPGRLRRPSAQPAGLRRQKKQRTHTALWCSAMRLFADRGITRTTIADIAESVGVSERTFFRYYPSKESLVTGITKKFWESFVTLAAQRPADEPMLRSVSLSIHAAYATTFETDEVDGDVRDGMRNLLKVLAAAPELNHTNNLQIVQAKNRLGELLCRRHGTDEDPRAYGEAHAALALVRESTYWWVRDPTRTIAGISYDMYESLSGGVIKLVQEPSRVSAASESVV